MTSIAKLPKNYLRNYLLVFLDIVASLIQYDMFYGRFLSGKMI